MTQKIKSFRGALEAILEKLQDPTYPLTSGMCMEILLLQTELRLSNNQVIRYKCKLSGMRPRKGPHFDFYQQESCSVYWWPRGTKQARIAWLKDTLKRKRL